MIIRPVQTQFSMRMDRRTDGRTDGQTDMTKLIVAFRNFTNAPKEAVQCYIRLHV